MQDFLDTLYALLNSKVSCRLKLVESIKWNDNGYRD